MDLIRAKEIAASLAQRLDCEQIELDLCLGRVLAEDVSASRDIPADPRSRWDGFALISDDSVGAEPNKPAIMDISRGEVTAGMGARAAAIRGRCSRIMTGGVLPEGADAVLPIEVATVREERLVVVRPVPSWSGVIRPGSEAGQNEILLRTGDVLTPTRIAVAAATGVDRLKVFRRPRVGILATGDELREPGGNLETGATFCNNIYLFANLVRVSGGIPTHLGIVPDDQEQICSRLGEFRADMIITTGGMGRGSKDFISRIWERLGVVTCFDGLNLLPGRGSAMGKGACGVFLGLPGNPWAGRIVYEEIAAPMIRDFQGVESGGFSLRARCARGIKKKEGFYQAVKGRLSAAGQSWDFIPVGHGSGKLNELFMFRSNLAYALIGPEVSHVSEGDGLEVKIPDFPLGAWTIHNS